MLVRYRQDKHKHKRKPKPHAQIEVHAPAPAPAPAPELRWTARLAHQLLRSDPCRMLVPLRPLRVQASDKLVLMHPRVALQWLFTVCWRAHCHKGFMHRIFQDVLAYLPPSTPRKVDESQRYSVVGDHESAVQMSTLALGFTQSCRTRHSWIKQCRQHPWWNAKLLLNSIGAMCRREGMTVFVTARNWSFFRLYSDGLSILQYST